jgi:ABC-type glycerol-3-phosphate transport system permease component
MTTADTYRRPKFNRANQRMMLRFIVGLAVLVVFLFPVYWLFITSLKSPGEIFARPPVWFPAEAQFNTFWVLFRDGDVQAKQPDHRYRQHVHRDDSRHGSGLQHRALQNWW